MWLKEIGQRAHVVPDYFLFSLGSSECVVCTFCRYPAMALLKHSLIFIVVFAGNYITLISFPLLRDNVWRVHIKILTTNFKGFNLYIAHFSPMDILDSFINIRII